MTTKLTCIISLVIRKKYVFKKTRIHYILNRMNKTEKKKKNYQKVMNALNT